MLLLLKCLFWHLESQLCGKAWLGDQNDQIAQTTPKSRKWMEMVGTTFKKHDNSNWNVKDPR